MEQIVNAEVHPTLKVVLEGDGDSWSAYAPGVPGCAATGHSRDDVQRNIESALTFHFEGLHRLGLEDIAVELQANHAV